MFRFVFLLLLSVLMLMSVGCRDSYMDKTDGIDSEVIENNDWNENIGTWGDQGNGYYKNPILNSNFPDNDVIFSNGQYYMISSTNNFIPGMTILKSKDLVNWEYSNNIINESYNFDDNLSLTPKPLSNSRGTWAGSIGYNGEYYFIYWCHNTQNLTGATPQGYQHLFSKSRSMEGPWSTPKELTWPDGGQISTTDPGVLFDIEKQEAWYVIPPGKIYKLSWDGEKLLQSQNEGVIVSGEYGGEANKLYKIGEWYYEMNAHVRVHEGASQRMEAIHRAKSVSGPWEGRLCLENGNGTNRAPSQGSLLQAPDGSWWYIHQLAWGNEYQRYIGRPQFLEPVEWKDGWPLIGCDTDSDGIGEVVWHHKKPISGYPIVAPATEDNFDGESLGLQWMWRYMPQNNKWSLKERSGFLRMKSCAVVSPASGSIHPESLLRVPNMLCQRLLGEGKHIMTTKFDISGMSKGMEAGFHLSSNNSVAIGVKNENGNSCIFYKDCITSPSAPKVVFGEKIEQSEIWFRCSIENGLVRMYYSLDGIKFECLGDETRAKFEGFTPTMIGFYAENSEETGYIDIDYFKYIYDGPKN